MVTGEYHLICKYVSCISEHGLLVFLLLSGNLTLNSPFVALDSIAVK